MHSVRDVMYDDQSYLKLCYSDGSHKFLLCFEGADCACYSDSNDRISNHSNSTVHCADDIDTASIETLKRNKR